MYKVSLPITITAIKDKAAVARALKEANADYIFIALGQVSAEKEKQQPDIEKLQELIPYFRKEGFKVGVWIWSLWIKDLTQDVLEDYMMKNHKGEMRLAGTLLNDNQKICSGFLCPTSKNAVRIMTEYVKELAKTGPDVILFDDDMDYATHLGSIGCYCDRHLEKMKERLGYAISREELSREVTADKPNDVRAMWYELMGETLEQYCIELRRAADCVEPNIRLGLCSVMSNWGTDGTTAEKLVKLLAGNTKPFMRLTGAPYWASPIGFGRLQHILELSRWEYSCIEDKGIEVLTEGDVYPRPRHKVPASYLEIFDTVLRAAGVGDGIHKYMLDYTSSAAYERGYLERHMRHAPIYEAIERIFSRKKEAGVRVYEPMNKVLDADFTGISNPHAYAADFFFARSSKMLSENTIPTSYSENDGVGIAFGESARHLPKEAFDHSLILDVRAARILMEAGIDIGIERIGDKLMNNLLYFPEEDDYVVTGYGEESAYELHVKDGAEIVVYSECNEKRYADTIQYANQDGQKFLIYGFDAAFTDETRFRNYYTQRQLCRSIEWLQGKKMAAKCLGNPDLYMFCKKGDQELAIGLWNIFADEIIKPVIELAEEYSEAEFIHCEGCLKGNILELSELPAYGFCFVNLKR